MSPRCARRSRPSTGRWPKTRPATTTSIPVAPTPGGSATPSRRSTSCPTRPVRHSLGSPTPSTGTTQPGDRVVDLGSGAGMDTFLAAVWVGPHGQVIGVDMTPEMLARSRRLADQLGLGNVEFRQGVIEALPVEDGWADVVISNGVINLCPDKVGA